MSELLDDKEAATKAVVDWMTKKSKNKTKFYFKDFSKVFPDDKPRLIKKVIPKWCRKKYLNTGLLEVQPCMALKVAVYSMSLKAKVKI